MAKKKKRMGKGFAHDDPDMLREISAKGGRARSEKLTAERRRQIASKAGNARKKRLTKKQRCEIARKAAEERWRRKREQDD
jgi:general stress protein YciG